MEWVLNIEYSLKNDINNCEQELQLIVNMNFEDENEKKKKIKNILEAIVLKEQALDKWQRITKDIKKNENEA